MLTISSGYEESKVYLEQNRGEQNLSTSNSYFEFYFGRNISEQIPPTLDAIGYLLKEGNFKFIILDFMSHRVLKKEAKVFIEEQCKPVARFKNEIGTNAFTLIESLGYRHDAKDYIRKALSDPHSQYIEIYKASDVLEALSRRNHGIISDNA